MIEVTKDELLKIEKKLDKIKEDKKDYREKIKNLSKEEKELKETYALKETIYKLQNNEETFSVQPVEGLENSDENFIENNKKEKPY